jgi:hypothetical protein
VVEATASAHEGRAPATRIEKTTVATDAPARASESPRDVDGGDEATTRSVAKSAAAIGIALCARLRRGAVLCWGVNNHSQLGDGSHVLRPAPFPVTGLP